MKSRLFDPYSDGPCDVLVVGGGASGLMAAGQAAMMGAKTLVLEKMGRPGRKLRITGKGRCNLTNSASIQEAITHFGTKGRFLNQAFSRFYNRDLVQFFRDLGVSTVTERGGRIFPASGKAQDVLDALVTWARASGVRIKTGWEAANLVLAEGPCVRGAVAGHNSDSRKRHRQANASGPTLYKAKAVIISTGGASYPGTGSTGDGYRLGESAGHTVVPIGPALVPLETRRDITARLKGLDLKNVSVLLRINGRKSAEGFGEMSFIEEGLSGPIVLPLSKRAVVALEEGKEVSLSIDFKPALDHQKLDARLIRDIEKSGKKPFKTLLKGLLPAKLIPVCMDGTGISADKAGHQITSGERKSLRAWLKDFRLPVTGYRSFEEALVTAGGVHLNEVDPRTMGSRLVKGLYFSGEVLDLDADTGGYNLQCAFSTGWLAGRSAAQYSFHSQLR